MHVSNISCVLCTGQVRGVAWQVMLDINGISQAEWRGTGDAHLTRGWAKLIDPSKSGLEWETGPRAGLHGGNDGVGDG